MPISLTINGTHASAPEGASVLDAVLAAGIDLPHLCKDPDQPAIGACRTCIVHIEGAKPYPAACHTPIREGMVVDTEHQGAAATRAMVLALTAGMGRTDHAAAATTGPSELLHHLARAQNGAAGNGTAGTFTAETLTAAGGATRSFAPRAARPTDTSSPFFTLDHSDCILCGRCVVACQDVQHISAIAVVGRGTEAHIGTHMDGAIRESTCTSCGQCVSVCPTGAILPKRQSLNGHATHQADTPAVPPRPDDTAAQESAGRLVNVSAPDSAFRIPHSALDTVRAVASTCPYCGVGCGVSLRIDGDDIIRFVDDDPHNLSSTGMLCVKGRFGTTFVHSGERLTTPLIRRNGQLVPCSWDEALDYAADRLIQYRGSFASLASAKATNEDGFVQQKFVRMLMGTNNIDHCTRLCHSPSVEAMLMQLGSGATSNSYEDYENAGCLMVIGCDPSSNHPVIASRLRRALGERGAKLIVVNPRRIDLCDYTDLWLRPFPGTDVALFNALAKVVLEEDLWDRAFVTARTEGFEDWLKVIDGVDVAECAHICGVPDEKIRAAARLFARPPQPQTAATVRGRTGPTTPDDREHLPYGGSCLIWGMGITQHTNGTANAHSLLNLALLTGQMGRFGSGVSPLRGQNNVQGCGDAGCIPDSLPGYQSVGGPNRPKFEAAWGVSLPGDIGLRATDMVEQAVTGEIKAMYIVGENPLLSEPNLEHAREGIEKLDFLVVQDIFLHETAELADVVLPAAAFAEKDGTFTNTERRVQRIRKAIDPPGLARPDWEIVADLARRVAVRLDRDPDQFNYEHPTEIFEEIGRLWPNVAGISYERLDTEGGLQWPCPAPDHPGTERMYQQSFPRGLGRFIPVEQAEAAVELPDSRFPLVLNTGRMLYHWHGGTITRRVAGLVERAPVVPVAVHPADAAKFGVADGEEVVISSRRGEMTATVQVSESVREGAVFVPFVRLAESSANWLTNNAYDKASRIPEYKVCAVRLDKPGEVRRWRRGRGEATHDAPARTAP